MECAVNYEPPALLIALDLRWLDKGVSPIMEPLSCNGKLYIEGQEKVKEFGRSESS